VTHNTKEYKNKLAKPLHRKLGDIIWEIFGSFYKRASEIITNTHPVTDILKLLSH
jgi:hypothetical protein